MRFGTKKFYLISWTRPLGGGYMGCIVDVNGKFVEAINNLFYKGAPTRDFAEACDKYKIAGKTQGLARDHFMLSGTSLSFKEAITKFKKEMAMY